MGKKVPPVLIEKTPKRVQNDLFLTGDDPPFRGLKEAEVDPFIPI
jgi:hypothetical protein